MVVSFDIVDEEMNKVLMRGIEGLSEEQVGKIAKKAIEEYLDDPKVIEGLIWTYGNGYGCRNTEVRPWFSDMISRSFSPEEMESYRKKLLEFIEAKKEGLVIDVLKGVFADLLFTQDLKFQLMNAFNRLEQLEAEKRR